METVSHFVARVQLIIPDKDRDQFIHQAKIAGQSLSAWLRAAAHEKLQRERSARKFGSVEEIRAFYNACDASADLDREPDWEEQKKVISQSKLTGSSNT